MKLHLLGLPHTVTRPEYSHCAFTGKVLRFSPMLRRRGYHVTHYGVEGAESGANEQVDVMSRAELDYFVGPHDPASSAFVGNVADVNSALYRTFNKRLRAELAKRVEFRDVVCLPFGHGHAEAVEGLDQAYLLETGIGYPTAFAPFRVFESWAWYHWHLGKDQRPGSDYHWVIPNYFDLDEWEPSYERGKYLLYFGRIAEIKGLPIVVEIAHERPDLEVVVCGQGDPAPWTALPNVRYQPPIWGRARSELLRNAIALLAPTRYVEPFGGVAVEAMLCGTPVLGSSFGAFVETVEQGETGYRCRTLGDWLGAVREVESWGDAERRRVRRHAERYDMHRLGAEYQAVLEQLADVQAGTGWYSRRTSIGGVKSA